MKKADPSAPVVIKDLAALAGTGFIEVSINGNLRKKSRNRAASIEINLPDAWAEDLFRRFTRDNAEYEYFVMRVKKTEIP